GERVEIEIHITLFGRKHRRGGSSRESGFELPAFPYASAILIDQLHEGVTHRSLVQSRPVYVPGNAEKFHDVVFLRTELPEPSRSSIDDQRHAGKGFHVVHHGRAAVETDRCREKRRLDTRLSALTFYRVQKSGFFAADVSTGSSMHDHVELVSGSCHVV